MYFKNNRTALIFLLAMLVVAPIKAQVAFGDAAKFNDGWLFRLTDDSAIVRTDYDDSEWRKLSLPHDWSIAVSYTHLDVYKRQLVGYCSQ